MVIYHSYGRLQPQPVTESAPRNNSREPSRVIGYHNAMYIDGDSPSLENVIVPAPPSYRTATLRPRFSPSRSPSSTLEASEPLPPYECTVSLEGPASIKFERTNPFEALEDTQWAEVFINLKGTVLSVHQLQTVGKLSKALGSPKPDGAGRLIKKYTLQHAEVGVASDAPKHELVPRTLAAAMWPQQKLKRMQLEAPHLFDHVRQYVIRLRLECDQLLLRVRSWEERAKWMDHLCMAVDISPPLEDRTEPTYHTLPRRRRHRHVRGADDNTTLSMTNLIEEQERIMRDRFPHLLLRNEQSSVNVELLDGPEDRATDPEAEDLDSDAVMAVPEPRPSSPRAQVSNLLHNMDHIFEARAQIFRPSEPFPLSTDDSVDSVQKSSPTVQLDRSQELRYRRRCMPSLLSSSRRSNDVVMRNGARWQIDWDAKALRPYPELPPRYENVSIVDGDVSRPTSQFFVEAPQVLRTMPSSATITESAGSSVDAADNSASPNARSAKSWKDPGRWSRRIRKPPPQMEEADGSSSGSDNSEGIGLHKLRRDHSGATFNGETLRMLGI